MQPKQTPKPKPLNHITTGGWPLTTLSFTTKNQEWPKITKNRPAQPPTSSIKRWFLCSCNFSACSWANSFSCISCRTCSSFSATKAITFSISSLSLTPRVSRPSTIASIPNGVVDSCCRVSRAADSVLFWGEFISAKAMEMEGLGDMVDSLMGLGRFPRGWRNDRDTQRRLSKKSNVKASGSFFICVCVVKFSWWGIELPVVLLVLLFLAQRSCIFVTRLITKPFEIGKIHGFVTTWGISLNSESSPTLVYFIENRSWEVFKRVDLKEMFLPASIFADGSLAIFRVNVNLIVFEPMGNELLPLTSDLLHGRQSKRKLRGRRASRVLNVFTQ